MASIGDLFISLGIKGSDKTIGAIAETKKGMEGLASTSFEAKAAIVGAMYALEQLFSKSGQKGMTLTNLDAVLGGGFKQTLQQYAWAADQVGIANEAVYNSFGKIQDVFAKAMRHMGPMPATLGQIGLKIGEGFSADKVALFAAHPEQWIQRMQKYAEMEKDPALREMTLSMSPGGSELMNGLVQDALTPQQLAKAPTLSDKELGKLDSGARDWRNVGNQMQMEFDKLNAQFGAGLAKNIAKIIPDVVELIKKFALLGEKLHVMEAVDMVFKGWSIIFKQLAGFIGELTPGLIMMSDLVGKAIDAATDSAIDAAASPEGQNVLAGASKKASDDFMEASGYGGGAPLPPDAVRKKMAEWLGDIINALMTPVHVGVNDGKLGIHAVPAPPAGGNNHAQNIDVNQTLNFAHPGNDPQKTADSHRQATTRAYRQLSALTGVS